MGKLNLLKGAFTGKVGEVVGAKWKDQNTVRTYTKPSNPNTPAQQTVRTVFGAMTSFTALFTDQIKYLTSLDTSGKSVRNAIVSLNKAQVRNGTFDKTPRLINTGGLPNVTNVVVTANDGDTEMSVTFVKPQATNISEKAKLILVAVDEDNTVARVGEGLLSTGTAKITGNLTAGDDYDLYYYVLDFRGSARVGSKSGYQAVTVA